MSGIVFLGDSITFATNHGGVTQPEAFAHLIGTARGYTDIYNAGVPSDQTAGVLTRLQADVLDLNPDECFLMIGANDWINGVSLTTYCANMLAISSAIQGAGIHLTIMSSVMRRGSIQEIAAQEKFAEVAEDTPCDCFIDVFRHFALRGWIGEHKPLYVDAIHLTALGHAYVADIAARVAHT